MSKIINRRSPALWLWVSSFSKIVFAVALLCVVAAIGHFVTRLIWGDEIRAAYELLESRRHAHGQPVSVYDELDLEDVVEVLGWGFLTFFTFRIIRYSNLTRKQILENLTEKNSKVP